MIMVLTHNVLNWSPKVTEVIFMQHTASCTVRHKGKNQLWYHNRQVAGFFCQVATTVHDLWGSSCCEVLQGLALLGLKVPTNTSHVWEAGHKLMKTLPICLRHALLSSFPRLYSYHTEKYLIFNINKSTGGQVDKPECIKHSCQGHVHLLKDCTRKKFNLQVNSTFWVIIYSVSFTVTVAERKCCFRMVSKCFDALYSADTAKHIYAFLPSNDAAKNFKYKYKGNIYIAHQNQNHNPYEVF